MRVVRLCEEEVRHGAGRHKAIVAGIAWKHGLAIICAQRRHRVGGVVGYRICLTHRRSSVRTWADSFFQCFSMGEVDCFHPLFLSPGTVLSELGPEEWCNND